MIRKRINVLDHGYVEYVAHMGVDEDIVSAARMSTGRGFVSWEAYKRCKNCDTVTVVFDAISLHGPCVATLDRHDWQDFPRGDLGILEYMYKGKHFSPFEFCELHVEVQAPIMVFREFHRHRTFSYSEFSARYSQMPNLHYVPALERVQAQGKTNRQGSGEPWLEAQAASVIDHWKWEQDEVYKSYDEAVAQGMAKEVARLNTPVSRYSKMRAKTDLRNWLGFLNLRMRSNAQYEIRCFAQAVAEIVKELWPRTYALFEEYDLYGVSLSRSEAKLLVDAATRRGSEIEIDLRYDAPSLLSKLQAQP
jgi:thymidylate synthase (FAD)